MTIAEAAVLVPGTVVRVSRKLAPTTARRRKLAIVREVRSMSAPRIRVEFRSGIQMDAIAAELEPVAFASRAEKRRTQGIFPTHCGICDRALTNGDRVCNRCRQQLSGRI